MVKETDYQKRIETYSWEDLDVLWSTILEDQITSDWDSGKALEYLILRAFQLNQAEIRWPYSVRFRESGEELEQIDGVIYLAELACLVECKDHSNKKGYKRNISFEPIAKMRSQLMRRPSATIGCIFSSGGFTEPALTLANFTFPQTILLWNGEEIAYCLRMRSFSQALMTKYRKCIEFGSHDYDITIEETL